MTPETEALIEDVLSRAKDEPRDQIADFYGVEGDDLRAEFCQYHRTAAPKLARMLRMHQELARWILNPRPDTAPPWFDEAMKEDHVDPCYAATKYVMAEIERIAKEGA